MSPDSTKMLVTHLTTKSMQRSTVVSRLKITNTRSTDWVKHSRKSFLDKDLAAAFIVAIPFSWLAEIRCAAL